MCVCVCVFVVVVVHSFLLLWPIETLVPPLVSLSQCDAHLRVKMIDTSLEPIHKLLRLLLLLIYLSQVVDTVGAYRRTSPPELKRQQRHTRVWSWFFYLPFSRVSIKSVNLASFPSSWTRFDCQNTRNKTDMYTLPHTLCHNKMQLPIFLCKNEIKCRSWAKSNS